VCLHVCFYLIAALLTCYALKLLVQFLMTHQL